MKFVLLISPPNFPQHFICVNIDIYIYTHIYTVYVYVNVLCVVWNAFICYIGENIDFKNVNMNINQWYYDYTLIISLCLTFHII